MIELLRRMFGIRSEPPTRMTRDAALAAARAAATAAGLDVDLGMTSIRREGDRTIWTVGTATVGSGVSIEIDDATGTAGPVTPWGVR